MLNFKTVNIISSLLLVGLLVAYSYYSFSIWFIILFLFAWFLITVAGSSFVGWNYHFTSLNSNPEINKNQIAITFDDGPNLEFTPKVLALLKKYNAKATFFCIGKNIEMHPEVFKSIIKEGHTIGNHTYTHSTNFGFFSVEKMVEELKKTNKIINRQICKDALLYRPTFGVTNPRIKRALQIIKLHSIGWNKRSLDTRNLSEQTILKRVTKNLKKGDVILLHDTSEKTISVLEQLLIFLQQQKIESVTIDSLFNIKAYA
ncbi:polysaccharide deacetylase family protein [Oceanihabitans sp. 2_MG-2023]|uniref:polysaccharide deacetylase family protein n=1 Tax=Oceanihabitans sp. 2_MG-2023 TaxID=3062661 RepID=UPI0026E27FD5|nr:polysaccharide deacetylase family protein [Oceanihabitans sp. 2_MG-2023]MDO6596022.1 polysaccharide deacetylase family protein [Oceanihabitans sp. 2_MG-2023]